MYVIKDYQRLKEDENSRLSLSWNLNREISKLNYRVHTDSIKENLIPRELTPENQYHVGDVFDPQTITLITYYGYIIISGVALLYWKLIEKKRLSEMGLTKRFGNYFIGMIAGVILLAISVFTIVLTGNIEFHGFFENADILMIILLIGGFIVQGATEEILCRGIVLHALKEKAPLWIAFFLERHSVLYSWT